MNLMMNDEALSETIPLKMESNKKKEEMDDICG